MVKYLFTDGSGKIIETDSREELQSLAGDAAESAKVRVWIFNSNEWISYSSFCKKYPETIKQQRLVPATTTPPPGNEKGRRWLKKFLFAAFIIAGALLIFNFTSVKWEEAAWLKTTAARPGNVPVMDIDSLITTIEYDRYKTLDRSTRTNLRLRNTWPDRILLQLNAEKETSSAGSRYHNLDISIDNTTGFNLDNAVVKLQVWKNGTINSTDTLQFNTIRFDKLSLRHLPDFVRADSLSVSFQSIRAKLFNFCYSANAKNNSGNYNDRWFCPGGNSNE